MEFDLEDPFTSFQENHFDSISDLFASENDHMPSENFICSKNSAFYIFFRNEAIALISQAQFALNLDPFISYLAINYMDRFIFKQEFQQGKPWLLRLVGVACLSIASKMKNSSLSASDIQREEGFIFDLQRVHQMELHILDALGWRMRSITPFSFLCFFISLLEVNDPPLTKALKTRASDIIFNAHLEIKFLEFKPSIVAASAILFASKELLRVQYTSLKASIFACLYVNNEKLTNCLNIMQEMKEDSNSIMWQSVTISTRRTPMSVLDNDFTDSESDKTSVTTQNRDNKRRKFNSCAVMASSTPSFHK